MKADKLHILVQVCPRPNSNGCRAAALSTINRYPVARQRSCCKINNHNRGLVEQIYLLILLLLSTFYHPYYPIDNDFLIPSWFCYRRALMCAVKSSVAPWRSPVQIIRVVKWKNAGSCQLLLYRLCRRIQGCCLHLSAAYSILCLQSRQCSEDAIKGESSRSLLSLLRAENGSLGR